MFVKKKSDKRTVKIIVNPKYESMSTFIAAVPAIFEEQGEVIYAGRNLIKVLQTETVAINVKRYRIPGWFNRLVYSFIRPSKGFRAFSYPRRLAALGIETPEPVAYIEERKWGVIGISYFLSVQSPYRYTLYRLGDANLDDCRDLVKAFARFTAYLHQVGVYHRDYSPGNILFDRIDGVFRFCLVDINRMGFGPVDMKAGCANFARLWGQTPLFELLADTYADARGYDRDECRKLVLRYRRRFWKRYRRRHPVRFNLDID